MPQSPRPAHAAKQSLHSSSPSRPHSAFSRPLILSPRLLFLQKPPAPPQAHMPPPTVFLGQPPPLPPTIKFPRISTSLRSQYELLLTTPIHPPTPPTPHPCCHQQSPKRCCPQLLPSDCGGGGCRGGGEASPEVEGAKAGAARQAVGDGASGGGVEANVAAEPRGRIGG